MCHQIAEVRERTPKSKPKSHTQTLTLHVTTMITARRGYRFVPAVAAAAAAWGAPIRQLDTSARPRQ
jgi:hypothetical protein